MSSAACRNLKSAWRGPMTGRTSNACNASMAFTTTTACGMSWRSCSVNASRRSRVAMLASCACVNQLRFHYRLCWAPIELLMYYNRCCMHRRDNFLWTPSANWWLPSWTPPTFCESTAGRERPDEDRGGSGSAKTALCKRWYRHGVDLRELIPVSRNSFWPDARDRTLQSFVSRDMDGQPFSRLVRWLP